MNDDETSQAQWHQQELENHQLLCEDKENYEAWLDQLNKQSMNGIEITTNQNPLNQIT